jgi:hypothetical protein
MMNCLNIVVWVDCNRRDKGGTGEYMKQKHLTRHYLDTMHPLEHPSQSRLPPKPKNITTAADDAPLTDFALPPGSQQARTTGFSSGHVRSMMQFDTFGPNDSDVKSALRSRGDIPPSPNVDHYRAQSLSPGKGSNSKPNDNASFSSRDQGGLEPFSDPKYVSNGAAAAYTLSNQSKYSNYSDNNNRPHTTSTPSRANTANGITPVPNGLHASVSQGALTIDTSTDGGRAKPTRTTSSNNDNRRNSGAKSLQIGGALGLNVSFSPSKTNAEVLKVTHEEKAQLDPFTKSRDWHKGYTQSLEVVCLIHLLVHVSRLCDVVIGRQGGCELLFPRR